MQLMLRFCDSSVVAFAILTGDFGISSALIPAPRCHSYSDQRSKPFLAEGSALGICPTNVSALKGQSSQTATKNWIALTGRISLVHKNRGRCPWLTWQPSFRRFPAKKLEQLRTFFSRHHLLPYGRFVRDLRRSFRSPVHGSARVVLNSLSRSEQAASSNTKRDYSGERRNKFFHLATSLRRKRVLASQLARSP